MKNIYTPIDELRVSKTYAFGDRTLELQDSTLSDSGIIECIKAICFDKGYKDRYQFDSDRELIEMGMNYLLIGYDNQEKAESHLQNLKKNAALRYSGTVLPSHETNNKMYLIFHRYGNPHEGYKKFLEMPISNIENPQISKNILSTLDTPSIDSLIQ